MVSGLVEVDASVPMSCSCCAKRNDVMKSATFQRCDSRTMTACNGHLMPSLSFKIWEPTQDSPETTAAFEDQDKKEYKKEPSFRTSIENITVPNLDSSKCLLLLSPGLINELDAAAIKLQKVYKSYRTRRNLADCAVLLEELWWKALDFASLKHSSISFFTNGKQETAASRWARARTRAAKVGKGLSKDSNAQKLALQHWLEAIDPRHRYGHNLNQYYDVWFKTESTQPFFYWLDIGDGKEVNLENCPRIKLQQQCIKYLGPKERQAYRVIVEDGKLVYKESGMFVNSTDGSKWIFVLSTSRKLYVGQKEKGSFQHSSFLAGGATTASGRLVVKEGILKGVWPYSGHYLPTEENFKEFINFLQENNVDLTEVKRHTIDEDDECSPVNWPTNEVSSEMYKVKPGTKLETRDSIETEAEEASADSCQEHETSMEPAFELDPPRKWTTGLGPRISCVRDYPTDLQFMALEQVKLSPRINPSSAGNMGPIPSPRPSPAMRLSPRLAQMIPYPHISLTLPSLEQKNRP